MPSKQVFCLAPEADVRSSGVAACMRRLWSVARDRTAEVESGAATGRRIRELRELGLISFHSVEGSSATLRYAPSPRAKHLLATASNAGWPARVVKYLKQSVPSIPGALFRLQRHDGEGLLEAFITDWSPFPAAAAVAVHPSHPLADPVDNAASRWTGCYVRNPLTGDLLPVWTADWVKPGFGTGAVVVNPAHSSVDLKFAHVVGLPIRFALAPTPPSVDPGTWPTPPVINSGVAVRTGMVDGQPPSVTTSTYLAALVEAGHAVQYTDRVLGSLRLAEVPVKGSEPSWRDVAGALGELDLLPGVEAVFNGPVPDGSVLVTSMAAIPELMLLRALHIDLHGADIESLTVLLVAQASGAIGPGLAQELALIGFGRVDEVTVVKAPQREQAQRFVEIHQSIEAPAFLGPADGSAKRVTGIMSKIIIGQLGPAFAELYKLQRDLRKQSDAIGVADRHAYFAAAYVLAGVELPPDYPLTATLDALIG